MISSLANYASATSFISPMASPFTSCPGTVSGQSITNFNVLLSGVNVFAQNLNYGFETFFQELRKANSINVGNLIGLSSGLLSQYDFENAYRYLCVDLSRKSSEAVDNISKSIQVIGTNSGSFAIDIIFFVEFERQIEIDINTGSLIA